MRKRKFILWLLGALLLLLDPITSTFRTPSSLLSFVCWFHLFHIARMEGNITLDRSSLQKLYLLWFGLVLFFFFFLFYCFNFVWICFHLFWLTQLPVSSFHYDYIKTWSIIFISWYRLSANLHWLIADYWCFYSTFLRWAGMKKKTKLKSQVNISIRSM